MTQSDDDNAIEVVNRFFRQVVIAGATLNRVTDGMSTAGVWQVTYAREVEGGVVANQPTSWALRQWPATVSVESVTSTHQMIAHAAEAGVDFVPCPIASEDGTTLVSHANALWELAPWMPGKAVVPATADSLAASARALRTFHNATANWAARPQTSASPPAIADRWRRLPEATKTDWYAVAKEAAAMTHGRPHARALSQLASLLPNALAKATALVRPVLEARSPVQGIQRDSRPEHFLFHEGSVTGLVDFGAATYDTPAVDLARLLGEGAGCDAALWNSGFEAYGPCTEIRQLVVPLAMSGSVLAAANWLRWIADGRLPPEKRLQQLQTRVAAIADGWQPPR